MRPATFLALAAFILACGKVEGEDVTIDASRAIDQTDGATTSDGAADVDAAPSPPDASGACTPDGGACTVIPPSTCESATAMATYGDPTCLAGRCVWKKTVTPCGVQSQCVGGACTAPTTK